MSLTNGRGSWVVGRGYSSWVLGVGVDVSKIIIISVIFNRELMII